MKFLSTFKKLKAKNRNISVGIISKDFHFIKMLGKNLEIKKDKNNNHYFGKIKIIISNEELDTNLKYYIVVDNNNEKINNILNKNENSRITIFSQNYIKKIDGKFEIKIRKKEIYEYHLKRRAVNV